MKIYENILKLRQYQRGVRIISYVRNIRIFVFICISYFPIFASALTPAGEPENLGEFVSNFIDVLDVVVMFLAGFGFFGFVIGVLKYVGAGGDEERLGKAKQLIIYGLVGMLIIFSFWGIASLLAKTYLGV